MAKTLQINFTIKISPAEFRKIAAELAPAFAAVPGLVWKVWNLNEATGEGGGFYLFEDDASLTKFTQSPLAQQVANAPFLADLSIKAYDVLEDVSRVTHAQHVLPVAAM